MASRPRSTPAAPSTVLKPLTRRDSGISFASQSSVPTEQTATAFSNQVPPLYLPRSAVQPSGSIVRSSAFNAGVRDQSPGSAISNHWRNNSTPAFAKGASISPSHAQLVVNNPLGNSAAPPARSGAPRASGRPVSDLNNGALRENARAHAVPANGRPRRRWWDRLPRRSLLPAVPTTKAVPQRTSSIPRHQQSSEEVRRKEAESAAAAEKIGKYVNFVKLDIRKCIDGAVFRSKKKKCGLCKRHRHDDKFKYEGDDWQLVFQAHLNVRHSLSCRMKACHEHRFRTSHNPQGSVVKLRMHLKIKHGIETNCQDWVAFFEKNGQKDGKTIKELRVLLPNQ